MLKRMVLTLGMVLLFFGLSAEENEIRDLAAFDRLEVSRGIEVLLIPSNENKALIISEHFPLDQISTEMKGSSLKISMTKMVYTDVMVQVRLSFTMLQKVTARNGAIVRTPKPLSLKSVEFVADAGALMEVDLKSEIVQLSAKKGSVIKAKGSANHLICKSSTGSSLYAEKIPADKVEAHAGSGANLFVHALNAIDAKGVSGGTVTVSGKPDVIVKSTSLGGKVIFKDLKEESIGDEEKEGTTVEG